MMDLIAFLRARLDEDEQVARDAVRWDEGCSDWSDAGEPDWTHIARFDPARVLREVEAKRRLLEWHKGCNDFDIGNPFCEEGCYTVETLAAVYSDHPDYREEWSQ